MNCGRCNTRLGLEAEFCWYCQGELCVYCWERHGHCGHSEADRANAEYERRKLAGEPLIKMPMSETVHMDDHNCWCGPILHYNNALTGAQVWVHRTRETAH